MKLEVCVSTISDIKNAISAKADRIELCSALSVGGVTPSWAFIKYAIGLISGAMPVHVLIRPREGDFVYNNDEVGIMISDIIQAKALGADGVVIGALNGNLEIDIDTCAQLMQAAQGMSVTFSRAFDLSADLPKSLEDVISLGCDRLLTSGGMPTAIEGAESLSRLHAQAAGRIKIMAGSGISADNLKNFLKSTQIDEIHGSFRVKPYTDKHSNSLPGLDACLPMTSAQEIRRALNLLRQ